MENIILSLLLIKSMTIYEMKKYIQQCLNTVCSDSLGSIRDAIKKLLNKGCIEYYEYTERSLLKKEYSITSNGLIQFTEWIQTPMNIQKVKNMEGGKFFFLGMAPKAVRIHSLSDYIESLVLEQEKLLQIKEFVELSKESAIHLNVDRIETEKTLKEHLLNVSGEKSLDKVVQTIYDYQIYNLEYGLTHLEYDIKFYRNILSKEYDNKE